MVGFAVLEDLDVALRFLPLAGNQRGDMRAVAVIVVRDGPPSVGREIKEPVGAAAAKVFAFFEP